MVFSDSLLAMLAYPDAGCQLKKPDQEAALLVSRAILHTILNNNQNSLKQLWPILGTKQAVARRKRGELVSTQ